MMDAAVLKFSISATNTDRVVEEEDKHSPDERRLVDERFEHHTQCSMQL